MPRWVRQKRGPRNRPEPHRPGPARHEVPPPRRSERHPPECGDDGGQPPRWAEVRPDAGGRAAHPPPARSSPASAEEAARGQSVRGSRPPHRLPRARHYASDRAQRRRVERATRPLPVGRRADVRVDSSVSAPRRPVRAAGGHSSWLPKARSLPDLPILPLKVLLGALRAPHKTSRRRPADTRRAPALLGFDVHSHAFILAPWRACVSLAGSVPFCSALLTRARATAEGSIALEARNPGL